MVYEMKLVSSSFVYSRLALHAKVTVVDPSLVKLISALPEA